MRWGQVSWNTEFWNTVFTDQHWEMIFFFKYAVINVWPTNTTRKISATYIMKQPDWFFFRGIKEQQRIWTFLGLLCTNIPLLHLLTVQICAVWNQNRTAFQTQDAGSCWIFCFKCVLGHADSSKLSAPNHLTDENEFVAVTDLKCSSEQVSTVGMINILRTVLNLSWGWQLRCKFQVLVQKVLAVNYSSTEIV